MNYPEILYLDYLKSTIKEQYKLIDACTDPEIKSLLQDVLADLIDEYYKYSSVR